MRRGTLVQCWCSYQDLTYRPKCVSCKGKIDEYVCPRPSGVGVRG